jgi:Kef-type K+ transport system membrane component KefB
MDDFIKQLLEEFRFPLTNPVLVFSIILLIILLFPIILRRFKVPGLIGLIISGIVIGPKGIGIIGENSIASEGWIKLFSTIGLLYIMFMAGLDLDLNQFKKYYRKSLVFGAMTFFLPLLLGFPVCYYLLDMGFMASLLTASMFSTHTLVSYPIVSKFGLTKHPAVAITVGGTILTDTAVLIILAIISSASSGNLDANFWIRLITSLTCFSLVMFLLIPRFTRWFLRKLDSEKTSQYILIMSVVFFSAFLAEVAGIEHIIGAFTAGLVLNKLIPHNSVLMNRIDFIGQSLFIPVFLIFVGMVVDYRVFFSGQTPLIFAGVLTGFAIFSKWFAALVTQWLCKLRPVERKVIFGLSTSHAAATLAIIMVGFQDKILDMNVVNGTVLLILFTCMVSSFVTENAGKALLVDLVDQSDDDFYETKLRNKHLVVAMNELNGNERLLEFAIQVSDPKVINPISVVSVLPSSKQAEKIIHKSRKNLEEIVKHFSGYETKLNTMATIDLNVASGISRVAMELVADVIIVNDSSNTNLIRIFNERDLLIDACDKTLFFCQIDQPSVNYNQIILLVPPLAELDASFVAWSERIVRFAHELKIKLVIYGTDPSAEAIRKVGLANNIPATFDFKLLESMEDFVPLDKISSEDFVVLVGARRGTISYFAELETLLSKLVKAFENNDRLIIYPGQTLDPTIARYDDISGSPIGVGVDTLAKIGKEVGSIFKKEE